MLCDFEEHLQKSLARKWFLVAEALYGLGNFQALILTVYYAKNIFKKYQILAISVNC